MYMGILRNRKKSPAFTFEKPASKLFLNSRKKIYKTKSALSNNFSFGPEGFWDFFKAFGGFKLFWGSNE